MSFTFSTVLNLIKSRCHHKLWLKYYSSTATAKWLQEFKVCESQWKFRIPNLEEWFLFHSLKQTLPMTSTVTETKFFCTSVNQLIKFEIIKEQSLMATEFFVKPLKQLLEYLHTSWLWSRTEFSHSNCRNTIAGWLFWWRFFPMSSFECLS